MRDDGYQTEENRPIRDERGRFLNGCLPGPGRPRGSLDLMAICRRRAKEEGVDLEEMVWQVAKSMFKSAVEGDVAAAKLILDRVCGPVEKAPTVAMQFNSYPLNENVAAGPPVPRGRELGEYLNDLRDAATELLAEPEDRSNHSQP